VTVVASMWGGRKRVGAMFGLLLLWSLQEKKKKSEEVFGTYSSYMKMERKGGTVEGAKHFCTSGNRLQAGRSGTGA